MIDLSTTQLINLWVELEDAYNGVSGFGSCTAEIYAYTVMPCNPSYQHGKGQYDAEDELNASKALYEVLTLFKSKRDCIIYIEGRRFGKWLLKERFQHRLHIRIKKKKWS